MGRVSSATVLLFTLFALSCADEGGSLYQSARSGDLRAVQAYLADGADIDSQDGGGFTPLHASIMHGHPQLTRYLLAQGADVNVHVAVDADTVRQLLAKGARLDAWSETRGTPLHAAVNQNSPEAVRLLLESGAPLNTGDTSGSSALHHGAGKGRDAVVTLLIDAGADIDAVNDLDFTPLHWAAGNGHGGVVAILMDSGAVASMKSHNGLTARDLALAKGHVDVARILERKGSDPS